MIGDKMFEKLGYTKFDNHPDDEKLEPNKWTTQDCRVIEYSQTKTINGTTYTMFIRFHFVGEVIEIGANKVIEGVRTMNIPVNPVLNMQEVRAIEVKGKELGWKIFKG